MPPSQVSMQDKEGCRGERKENEIISDKNQCLHTFLFVSLFQLLIWLLALERYKNHQLSPPILTKLKNWDFAS